MRDDEAMRAALDVAASARRIAPPWPFVGAAVVAAGELVGVGATGAYRTGTHAEPAALRAAGERARGATIYTTLEPCNHHGNTPPCTEAIIDAGVSRVVSALEDPDPIVAGSGFERLRAAGIEVVVGVGAHEARRQLAPYIHHRVTGRAWCVAKTANSIDGYVAAADGSSQWITADSARADVHALRADSQAVVVGAGTALADRPSLTIRDLPADDSTPLGPPPLRVLLDAHGRVGTDAPLFDTTLGSVLVVTTERASTQRVDEWRAAGADVETVAFANSATGRGVDLHATLSVLGARGVLQAMVEGGAALHGALLAADLVDHLVVYVGNTLLGVHGLPTLAVDGPASITNARRWTLLDVQRFGNDIRLDYRREEC